MIFDYAKGAISIGLFMLLILLTYITAPCLIYIAYTYGYIVYFDPLSPKYPIIAFIIWYLGVVLILKQLKGALT